MDRTAYGWEVRPVGGGAGSYYVSIRWTGEPAMAVSAEFLQGVATGRIKLPPAEPSRKIARVIFPDGTAENLDVDDKPFTDEDMQPVTALSLVDLAIKKRSIRAALAADRQSSAQGA